MNRRLRRTLMGALAGLAASYPLVMTQEREALAVLLGVLVGIVYSIAFRPTLRAYADSAMTAAALGVPAWVFFGVLLFPLFGGEMLEWTNGEMRARTGNTVAERYRTRQTRAGTGAAESA